MITALLTTAFVWCLFYGRISPPALALLCVALGVVLALLTRRHTQFLSIDMLAQISRLNSVNPTLKFWSVLILMAICIASHSPLAGIFLMVATALLTVLVGGLKPHDYIRMLALPVSFLMISGLTLLFELTTQSAGVISIPIFGWWLCVSPTAQAQTAVVIARALGALSCLYLLSLTTPMSEIIGVLRRAHCPALIISLMYLIYRNIFMLLSMYHTMKAAAASRMGYADYRRSLHSTGNLYANLLSRGYQQANRNFDAMESRCFDTEIRFLEHRQALSGVQAVAAISLIALTLSLSLLPLR